MPSIQLHQKLWLFSVLDSNTTSNAKLSNVRLPDLGYWNNPAAISDWFKLKISSVWLNLVANGLNIVIWTFFLYTHTMMSSRWIPWHWSFSLLHHQTVDLSWGDFCPSGDSWQCLKTFWGVVLLVSSCLQSPGQPPTHHKQVTAPNYNTGQAEK